MERVEGVNTKRAHHGLAIVAALALSVSAGPALALSLGFTSITVNDAVDAALGAAQISVDVTDAGNGQVLLTFANTGPDALSITNIYFDDAALLAAVFIDNSDVGVDFEEGGNPKNLPGAGSMATEFTATQVVTSGPPRQPNGVNPGESVGLLFDLEPGLGFIDVLDDLDSGALRIGLHVQGFDSGGSESYVNVNTPIPEPGTMVGLSTFALVGVATTRWRRRSSATA